MKYLIEIHHGIGDIIQMLGVVETIYRGDNRADIDLILNKKQYDTLFENDCRIRKKFHIDLITMKKSEILKVAFKMRKENYDYMFISPISNHWAAQMLAFLVKPKLCCGEQLLELSKVNKSRYKKSLDLKCHMVIRNQNVFRSAELEYKAYLPKLCDLDAVLKSLVQRQIIEDKGRQRLGICVGTSLPAKTWDIYKFIKISEIFTEKGYQVLLIGGEKEKKELKNSLIKENDRCENLLGRLNLIESAAALKTCIAVIGGDTGMMHIAAAVGCSTLTIFSCTDPQLHCPFSDKSFYITKRISCQYCYYTNGYKECHHYKCLDISIEEVSNALQVVLDGNTNSEYYFDIKNKGDKYE